MKKIFLQYLLTVVANTIIVVLTLLQIIATEDLLLSPLQYLIFIVIAWFIVSWSIYNFVWKLQGVKAIALNCIVSILLTIVLLLTMGLLIAKRDTILHPIYLVKVTNSGGLCGDLLCTISRERMIYKIGNSDLQKLVDETDFSLIRKNAFTKLCPSAYDGPNITYTFYTSHGVEQINDCITNVDKNNKLFKEVWKHLL
jgi:hypothetical protein